MSNMFILVGEFNHLETSWEFVNGKDHIPYMKWKNKNHVWNHQPEYKMGLLAENRSIMGISMGGLIMLIWYIQPTLLGAIPYHAISSRSPATPSGSERRQWWCCQHRSVQSPSAAASPTRPVPYGFPKCQPKWKRKTAQKAHVLPPLGGNFLQFSCLTVMIVMSQTGKSHDSLEHAYASPPVPSCSTKSKRSCNVASRIDVQKEFGTIFASLESVKRSNSVASCKRCKLSLRCAKATHHVHFPIIFPHFPRVFPHLFGDLWSSWPGRSWSLRAISNWIWLGCRTPMDAKMGGGPGRSTCAAYCGLQMGNLGECCPGFPLGSRFKFWVMLFRWFWAEPSQKHQALLCLFSLLAKSSHCRTSPAVMFMSMSMSRIQRTPVASFRIPWCISSWSNLSTSVNLSQPSGVKGWCRPRLWQNWYIGCPWLPWFMPWFIVDRMVLYYFI